MNTMDTIMASFTEAVMILDMVGVVAIMIAMLVKSVTGTRHHK